MKIKRKFEKKAQQEMVGFVLIIVLVVVVMMVFLVISLKKPSNRETDSLEVTNMLNSIMDYTTNCAIVFIPQYESIEELFKSAYEGKRCSNLNRDSEEYLKETLGNILGNITTTDSLIAGYELSFLDRVGDSESEQFRIIGGDCSGNKNIRLAQRIIVSGSSRLIVRIKICEN